MQLNLFSCNRNSLLASTIDKFGKWYLPCVHLDDLYSWDDLVHQPHTFICSNCSFQAILGCFLSKETCKQLSINLYCTVQSISHSTCYKSLCGNHTIFNFLNYISIDYNPVTAGNLTASLNLAAQKPWLDKHRSFQFIKKNTCVIHSFKLIHMGGWLSNTKILTRPQSLTWLILVCKTSNSIK